MDEEIKFLTDQIKSLKADVAQRAQQIDSNRHYESDKSDRHYQSDRSDSHFSMYQSVRHRKSDQTDRNGQDDRGDEYTLLDETDCGSDFSFGVANTESPEIVVGHNKIMPKTQHFDTNDGNNVGCTSTQTQNEILSDRPVAASSQGDVKGHQMSSHNRMGGGTGWARWAMAHPIFQLGGPQCIWPTQKFYAVNNEILCYAKSFLFI
jgi:hypothetical protein